MRILLVLFFFIGQSAAICLTLLNARELYNAKYNPGRLYKWNRKSHVFDLIEGYNQNYTSICSADFTDDLTGKTILISGEILLPYLGLNPDNSVTGYIGDIWTTLEEALKFKSVYRPAHDAAGSTLLRGEVDAWLVASAMHTYSGGHFSYSQQVVENFYSLYVLSEGKGVSKWWYMNIFSRGLWSMAFTFAIGITGLLIIMYRFKRATCRNYVESNNELAIPSYNFISILGVMTGQGFQTIPISWSLRFIVISAVIMGMLISCGFSSTLTSYLAIRDNSLPLTSLQDIVKKKTHSLCVRNETHGSFRLEQEMKKDINRINDWKSLVNKNCPDMNNAQEFSSKVCKSGFVYLEAPDVFLSIYRPVHYRCHMAEIPNAHWSVSVAFLQARSATHRRIVDRYILRLRSAGILKYLERKWISREWPPSNDRQWGFKPVEHAHVDLITLALFIMIIVSGFICILENIWFRLVTRRAKQKMALLRLERLNNLSMLTFDFPSRQLDKASKRVWMTNVSK